MRKNSLCMSDYSTNSTINLSVNGREVENKIEKLEKQLVSLRKTAEHAAEIGDKGTLQKTQKEIIKVENQLRKVRTATANVEQTLQNLDKARPNNLKADLRTLKTQLNGIERGSEAWNEHVRKIRIVDAELKKINAELKEGDGFWGKWNRRLNDWQTSIAASAAAVTGLVMAGRSAVSAYSGMDAELANVRKFTGMAEEEVEKLNDEFKEMETRTSRIDLNKLAEEAGRLGKTSQDEVMGFVKAANVINVALDDLGDGATLTLSKLTNIFGDEERLGTEEALLSVGSVINELSQNCTASAPYLADFAQRLAGVGAQAGLTIPQIMAFGAVLDSQGQAVEMSATALSQLTMDLFKNTEKVAKAVGIPLKDLQDALSRGTNEGLILLLERLHELGDMSVLAPVFKDMGENGARASQVIAALAGNIETVKWQQQEATKAFNEATSVTKEYEVQNSTVEAKLEKAKKRVSELAIELGEKLMPVMQHVISSTTVIMKAMSTVISFFMKYSTEIIAVTAAILAYNVAINAQNILFRVQYGWLIVTETAQKALNAAQAIGKVVTTGLTLAYERLVWQTKGATAAQQAYNKALKAAGSASVIGLVITLVTALGVALYKTYERQKAIREEENRLNKIKDKAITKSQEQINKINLLREAANNETLSMKQRQQAVENLNKIIPGYNAQIDETTGKLKESTKALKDYIAQLIHQQEVEGAKSMLQEIANEKAQAEIDKANALEEQKKIGKAPSAKNNPLAYISPYAAQAYNSIEKEAQDKVDEAQARIDAAVAKQKKILNVYGNDLQEDAIEETNDNKGGNGGGGGGNGGNGSSGTSSTSSKTKTDILEKEKEWKAQQEALNRIAYAKGEENFEEYNKRILEIEIEYQQKVLEHQELSETERLNAQASLYEAEKKQADNLLAEEKKVVDERYNEIIAVENQRYIDGKISYETYNDTMKQIELRHLKEIMSIYKEGTEERINAQKAYEDALLEDQKARRKKFEDLEKKHQEKLRQIKEKVFGNNAQQNLSAFNEDMAALQEVYDAEIRTAGDNAEEKLRIEEQFQKAKMAMAIAYNQVTQENGFNQMQIAHHQILQWLDSDGGKAVMGSFETITAGMSSIFSQMSSLVQSELEIQTAAIEGRYEKEIQAAEGNQFKINQIEKKKEEETAKIKNEANKKMFAMEVIQAVASTAQGAINAYTSAAQVPMVGYILAPIAAATAIAAGMMQVASIKKQQEASMAQGYAEGGYTPKGGKYQPVGVVHAGEWVASQSLLANPSTAAIIQSLDYAQRTNTIGSITPSQVNEDISSNMAMSRFSSSSTQNRDSSNLTKTIKSLNERLKEPFITVNTVTGDHGIKKAQEEYNQYISNKTPKRYRK